MVSVNVRTQKITREKLARFFPGNHELLRLLENLSEDVIVSIPGAVNALASDTEDAADLAHLARALATAASEVAALALDIAQQSAEGPPPAPPIQQADDAPPFLPMLSTADDTPPAAPFVLPDIPDDLYAQLASLRERVTNAERAIANFKEGPTP